jgi:hypothetical protein
MPHQPSLATPLRRRSAGTIAALTLAIAISPATAGARTARAHEGPSAASATLDWFDTTARTVAASTFTEQSTNSRIWAVSWLAAARATSPNPDPRFTIPALATALHDTLAAQVPGQAAQLDDTLEATLADVHAGRTKQRGIEAGHREAARVLAERAGDGLDQASVNVAWTPPPAAPGIWQPTPPGFGPAVRAGLGNARSFLLGDNDRFRPPPPPALDSEEYLDALAEVRSVGSLSSAVRTPEQTAVARFWEQSSLSAYTGVLRAVLSSTHRSPAWQARLVAAFHTITVDAQIAIHEAKYAYVFWRPVTAIRTGDVDRDPAWTPFFNTPSHPEYPSGHAGYAGAAERVLEALIGPRPAAPFTITSGTAPGEPRTYADWSTLTEENVDGRVWEGVHFRFSDVTAVRVGSEVADYDLRRLRALGL